MAEAGNFIYHVLYNSEAEAAVPGASDEVVAIAGAPRSKKGRILSSLPLYMVACGLFQLS